MAAASAAPSRRLYRGLAILWVVVLWMPVFQMVFHPFPERGSLAENRGKAQPPRITGGRFGFRREFPKEFDRYFDDTFGFRESLIRSHASLLYRILRVSPTESVILGKEGWLYYNKPSDGQSIRDYTGLAAFSAADLSAIESNLTTLAAHLRERGIVFALVVGPSKHTIYPEYLPDAIRSLAGETQLDQLARVLSRHPEIIFVDPRGALTAGKSRSQLYFKTDTHWNGAGALLVFRELMKALERAGVAVTAPADEGSGQEWLPPTVRDLSVLLGVPGPEMEADLDLERLVAPNYSVKTLPAAPGENPAFATVVCESDDPGRPRLVMLRDSFTEHLKPLLCASFSRTVFFWRYWVDTATLGAEKPAVLALEITERYLDRLQRASLRGVVAPVAPGGSLPGM